MKHFSLDEFDSPDVKGSGSKMNTSFLLRLDELRERCDFPFKINSGYRTKEHNEKVGGSHRSSHLDGIAVDIHCNDSARRFKIVSEAVKMGFSRIGIANTFIHIDDDTTKSQGVIWLY
jgi:zinc D-Ala-D-Ala carboxypeptidase